MKPSRFKSTHFLPACVLVLLLAGNAPARIVQDWPVEKLESASDLVAVGVCTETNDLDEHNTLGWTGGTFRGVESAFRVLNVLKGMPANDRILVHHYRIENWSPANGPGFLSFAPGSTNQWVLYLVKDGSNRYAPVAGQVDPGISIKPMRAARAFGFPLLAPLADANPAVRHPVHVFVPARLQVTREGQRLMVSVDTNSLASIELMMGTNMAGGIDAEVFVYPGDLIGRPPAGKRMLSSGLMLFDPGVFPWAESWNDLDSKKRYVVELDITLFETDVPPQHMWSPQGRNYKILWQKTLKAVAF